MLIWGGSEYPIHIIIANPRFRKISSICSLNIFSYPVPLVYNMAPSLLAYFKF